MRWTAITVPLAALLACSCAAVPPPINPAPPVAPPPPVAASLVVTGVSIVDPETGTASAPQDILIAGRDIAAIAPAGALTVPTGTPHLDGAGRFAMPGLIDVHAHLGEGGIVAGSPVGRERALKQFLRYGVTTIFVPGASGASDADFPALRENCRSGAIACPGIFGSASLITAPGSHPISTIFQMPLDTPAAVIEPLGVTMLQPGADIPALVAAKKAAGADAIKIIVEDGPPPWYPKPRLSDAQVGAITAAAHALSLPVFAHISTAAHVQVILDAGVDGIMHSPTDRMPDQMIRRMAEQRVWYVPTFALFDGILTWARKQRESDPYALKGVEPSAIESLTAPPFLAASAESEAQALGYLANGSDNIRRAAAAGVPIALGSDVGNPFVYPGYSAHEELSLLVRVGLTPKQALHAGTLGAAAFLRSPRVGRLATGFEADLILLARNPLDRIENSRGIVAVISDGKLVPAPVTAD